MHNLTHLWSMYIFKWSACICFYCWSFKCLSDRTFWEREHGSFVRWQMPIYQLTNCLPFHYYYYNHHHHHHRSGWEYVNVFALLLQKQFNNRTKKMNNNKKQFQSNTSIDAPNWYICSWANHIWRCHGASFFLFLLLLIYYYAVWWITSAIRCSLWRKINNWPLFTVVTSARVLFLFDVGCLALKYDTLVYSLYTEFVFWSHKFDDEALHINYPVYLFEEYVHCAHSLAVKKYITLGMTITLKSTTHFVHIVYYSYTLIVYVYVK